MSHSHRHTCGVLAIALAFSLAACGGEVEDDNSEAMPAEQPTEVEVTSTFGRPEQIFDVQEVDPFVTTDLAGQRVEDPAMPLSYKWQGSSYAPGGGSVIVVAVTNESDAPLPTDALRIELNYNSGSGDMQTAGEIDAEAAGVDIIGLDHPLGPRATVNAKYAFDAPKGNLWNAQFTIGNVTFEGNLS